MQEDKKKKLMEILVRYMRKKSKIAIKLQVRVRGITYLKRKLKEIMVLKKVFHVKLTQKDHIQISPKVNCKKSNCS